jgi:hypothetical protein
MTDGRRHDFDLNGDTPDTPDDLDRLFARLESPVAPPALIPEILAQTVETAPARVAARQRARMALWALYGCSLALVALFAVSLGQALHASGALDYLSFALQDRALARESPGLFWSAFVEDMPWLHLVPLALALAGWLVTTIALLRSRPPAAPPAGLTPHAATGAAA